MEQNPYTGVFYGTRLTAQQPAILFSLFCDDKETRRCIWFTNYL